MQIAYIFVQTADGIAYAIVCTNVKPLDKMQRPTRFAKISLFSLVSMSLSVHGSSPPKSYTRASYKAISDMGYRFKGVVRT